jgi:hypothetical protein
MGFDGPHSAAYNHRNTTTQERTKMTTAIHDLAERVAIAAVTKIYGPVDDNFKARFRHNFQARLNLKEHKYPIYDAVNTAFHEVFEAGFNAAVATSAASGLPQMQTRQSARSDKTPLTK